MKPQISRLEPGPGMDYLKPVLELLPELNIYTGPWIAGGAARRVYEGQALHNADIDVFIGSSDHYLAIKKKLDGLGAKLEHTSKAALSYTYAVGEIEYKLQIIKRQSYRNPQELIGDFDFTVCQVVTDGEYLFYGANALDHIDNKVLAFAENGRVAPINIARRALKYFTYGFVPEGGVMTRVVTEGLKAVTLHDIENSNYSAQSQPIDTWIQNASTY